PSISPWIRGRFDPEVSFTVEYGNRRLDGIEDWRLFGRELMQALVAAAAAIWPDEPVGEWAVTAGDGTATVTDWPEPPTAPAWAVEAGDGTATITSYPGMT
ncbi:hypothetical protein RZS08_65255, partial [Arthrospira platensis SPKY1]|nr:hypothetical protein [Arthrospira platensis SPKY1]